MINYETILSNFQDKVTLMQWLKKVEEALKNASLSSVNFKTTSPTSGYFTFIFADGTKVDSPIIDLPRGPQGPRGLVGPKGDDGASFRIVGSVTSVADLPSTALAGEAFFVGVSAPRDVYVYDALTHSWVNQGPLNASILLSELAGYIQAGTNISFELNAEETQFIITCTLDAYTKTEADNLLSLKADASAVYDKEYIDDMEEDILEVAEGKTASYVIDDLNDITGIQDAQGDYTNVTAITGVTMADLKIGDIILVKDLDVADYWVSQVTPSVSLNRMETSKVDLLNGIYPVGSVYMSMSVVNPASLFGGTWQALNGGNALRIPINTSQKVKTGIEHIDATEAVGKPLLTFRNSDNGNHGARSLLASDSYGQLMETTAYSGSAGYGLIPTNLWADNSDGIPVYMWQRTA